MRVFLCQSYLGPNSLAPPLAFPIGIAYLASIIKNDHEVFCWDPNIVQHPLEELPRLLEKISPDIVGLSFRNFDSGCSFNNRWYYPFFKSMVKTIKAAVPFCKLVVGGSGFTIFYREIMERNPEIDFGVVSEGEHSFLQLLKNQDHPEKVSNLVLRRNSEIYCTNRSVEDFDSLPAPERDLFEINEYKRKRYTISVQTKRGCGFNCIFCPCRYITGTKYRLRSPKKVVDEIEHLVNNYDLDSYFIVDSTFNHEFEHSRRICQELVTRKIEADWSAEFAPAFVNERFMKEAVKSGCKLFYFSPDGASDRALQFLGKDMEVEHIKKTISLTRKIEEANAGFNFMYDLPMYNSEHVSGLACLAGKMISELREKLYFIALTKLRIFPHTPLYDFVVKEGKLSQNTDLLYPLYYSKASKLSMENVIPELLQKTWLGFEAFTRKCRPSDF